MFRQKRRPHNALLAFAVTALGVSHLWAQQIPDPSPELQRQEQQRQELRQRLEIQPWSPSTGKRQTPSYQKIPEEQPCVRVESVVLQGTLVFPALHEALLGLNADDPPQGRCLGDQGITLLIQRVQEALIEGGYITSQPWVPEQDLKSGTLTIQIREGRIAEIRSAQADETLPRLAWAFSPSDIFNLRDIEQSADNLRRLPSLQPRIQIEAGQAPGTSDVLVSLGAQRPLRLGLSMDDAGSRTTGKIQGNATLSWDNPLGLADMAYISAGQDLGDKDDGPRASASQILHYSLPWGYWQFGATRSDNSYYQTVFGPYQSYRYSGTSRQTELAVQRVMHRNSQSKTTASVRGFLRESNNYIDDLEVLVQRRRTSGWEAGVQHLHYVEWGTLNAQFNYRRGTGAFDAEPAPEEATGQGTGHMRLMTGALQWSMPLELQSQALQYSTELRWQWSQTRLTPQDKFCIGGRSTVRGYDGQQTLCGDQGKLWRQELAWALPGHPAVQLYAALDAGYTGTPDLNDDAMLAGAAIGLRGSAALLDKYSVQFDVFVGKPTTSPAGFGKPDDYVSGFSLRTEF